jgi:Endoplasmic reticulum vesicle transporter
VSTVTHILIFGLLSPAFVSLRLKIAAKGRLEGDEMSEEETEFAEKVRRRRQRLHHSWVDADHPGCQLSGHLLVDRVPGNFRVQARSNNHDLVPHMTNVSHVIHSLSIGEPLLQTVVKRSPNNIPLPPTVMDKVMPMNGNVYVTHELHEAYHHHLKIISTTADNFRMGERVLHAYQILQNSQLAFYRTDVVPEAKFIMDLSPIAINYRRESRHWYDYVTSVMAIVGGAFVAIGMIESTLEAAVGRRRRY